MVLGRCGFLSTVRYASELSKNRYGHNRIAGSFLIPSVPLSITERRSDRPEQPRLPSSHLSVRMASRVANDSTDSSKHKDSKVNRLALEKSSYLLQHATNPVNWYPWCDEALERAKREDKVIFLSVGYSTCHWCHVMEKESFVNKEIAEIMNKNFINIKVDREERPDIDRIYMSFIMAATRHGGWPMSVFLSPDLKPISGGTYFPPEDRYGCRGFKKVLLEIAGKWKEAKSQIVECGEHNIKVLEKISHSASTSSLDLVIPVREISQMCVQQLAEQFEPTFGGFVSTFNMWSPKFPQPVNFNFLFHMYAREPDEEVGQNCLHMCVHTLTKMVKGGIHDHVGQGFSRYSVDGMWHVPHFEKMLYDQGQLMQSFADAFIATKTDLFAETIDDIATYVARDLRHKEGGFYSAEDADSYPEPNAKAKKEGAFYVWTMKEIKSLLTKKIPNSKHLLSDVFCLHYNVKEAGNLSQFQDPHNELKGKNVLIVLDSIDETAKHFNLSVEDTKKYLKEACSILYTARSARPRPHLDDKIVAAWNGLMISGLARGGTALDNNQYIEYAIDAAKFIERYLFDKDSKVLLRTCYRGENDLITQGGVPIEGFVDDYAFVIKGFLDLYEACLDDHWLDLAEELQDIQDKLFWDEVGGGYFSTTTKDSSIILRLKDVHDGAEPSGNSIAAGNLLRLAAYFGRSEFKDKAERMFKSFRSALMQRSGSIPQLTSALLHSQDSMTQIYIAGKRDAKDTNDLRRVIYSRLIPGRVLLLTDESKPDNILFRKNEFLRKMKQQDGRATVYVCRHHTCSLPVTCPNRLAELLDERH